MSEPEGADKARLTGVGCVLTTLSFALIFGVAIPIITWRDSTGHPLPRTVAIACPVLIGAVFHGIGTVILRLFGLRVLSEPEKEEPPV
jgi:hypothetical protein